MGFSDGKLELIDVMIVPFIAMTVSHLYYIGLPWLFILAVVAGTIRVYQLRDKLSLSYVLGHVLLLVVKVFFREISYTGTSNIPVEGPVIFVCAPHANQFLDPILVMKVVGREVGFLAAAKSMRRKWVGMFGRAMNSIPVERPQDLAKPGKGKITGEGKLIHGQDTKFTELQVGWSIVMKGEPYPIAAIESDTELTLSLQPEPALSKDTPISYGAAPKVEQNTVFETVFTTLHQGKCVGIFPEGGSHDRSDMLPLKAGVTIMALGAMAKYPGLDVKIVPVGLNYFSGHRFRSKAFIDIGEPVTVPAELVEKYKAGGTGKREACSQLLSTIHSQLKAHTVNAPNHETLQLLWAIRRLYKPNNVRLTTDQTILLTRRLEEGYEKFAQNPKVQAVKAKTQIYNHALQALGLRDHQVVGAAQHDSRVLLRLIYRIFLLFTYVLVALPGAILNGPIILVARHVSKQKAVEAKAASTVKIEGKDVLATWKVMVSATLFVLALIVYPAVAALIGYLTGYGALQVWAYFALFQPFIMYLSVRATEVGLVIARSILPMINTIKNKTSGDDIRRMRNELSSEIRSIVDELGPVVFGPDFDKLRLIKPNDFANENKQGATAADIKGSDNRDNLEGSANLVNFPDI